MNAPLPPTGSTDAELTEAFIQLWNNAQQEMDQFMRRRCPPQLQDHLQYYIDNNPTTPPPDPSKTVVSHGDRVVVAAGTSPGGTVGTIMVVGGVVAQVMLDSQPTTAKVQNGANVVVQDAAGAAVDGSPGVATVSGQTLQNVKLTV